MSTAVTEAQYLERMSRATSALAAMEQKLAAYQQKERTPIAIIGMGCRMPGGVDSPQALWHALYDGVDAVRKVPAARNLAPHNPWAGWLDDVDGFDAAFFNITPREAEVLDPQQRLLLQVSWEALEHAGEIPSSLTGKKVAIYVGISSHDYASVVARSGDTGEQGAYALTGNTSCFAAGRLAHFFGTQGPCMSIDTACSSSLVALHQAVQSLRRHESDMALVAGVNLIVTADSSDAVGQWQALAPDGRCKAFDAAANGFVRAEGCGVVVLKRQEDAAHSGNRVWAIVKGTAVNHDGRATGLTAPNVLSQQALLRDALRDAGLTSSDVGYIETHGTGTALGDPIELEALREVFASAPADAGPCVLGALKTNFGHMEAAAGIAGLIKTTLVLNHEEIPKNLHFTTLNPRMSLDDTRLAIASERTVWARGARPRCAGVSSFGMSGTNAHAILAEPPAPARSDERVRGTHLLLLSSRSAQGLRDQAARTARALSGRTLPQLSALCHSAATQRTHHGQRLAIVADSSERFVRELGKFVLRQPVSQPVHNGQRPKVAFVFSGHGSQWQGMARALLAHEPVFRREIERCDEAIAAHSGWHLLHELQSDTGPLSSGVNEYVQPALFSMAVALSALWRSWNVLPDAVIGHSMGEVAAAYVSGALGLEDAVRVICERSRALRPALGKGGMVLVELDFAEASELIRGHEQQVAVAIHHSPGFTVLSGELETLRGLVAKLEEQAAFFRYIHIDHAAHSPQMDAVSAEIAQRLRGLAPRRGHLPMYSTLRDEVIDGAGCDADYWARNLREPVRFASMVQRLALDGVQVFIEISPHPLLVPAVQEILTHSERSGSVLASSRRDDAWTPLLEAAGALYVRHYPVDWSRVQQQAGGFSELPTYAWQTESFWVAPRDTLAPAEAPTVATPAVPETRAAEPGSHALLGARAITPADREAEWYWQSELSLDRLSLLQDHSIQGAATLPAAAYLDAVWSAAREVFPDRGYEIERITFSQPIALAPDQRCSFQLRMSRRDEQRAEFAFYTRVAAAPLWSKHAEGTLRLLELSAVAPERIDALSAAHTDSVATSWFYAVLADAGFRFGPTFRRLRELSKSVDGAFASLTLPAAPVQGHTLDPSVIDAALQVPLAVAASDNMTEAPLPYEMRAVRFYGVPTGEAYAHAHRAATEPCWRVRLLDRHGAVQVEIGELHVRAASTRGAQSDDTHLAADWLRQYRWLPARSEVEPAAVRGVWLLVAGPSELRLALAHALRERGAHVIGAAFDPQHSAAEISVDPNSAEAFSRVLADIEREHGVPRHIVHLASLQAAPPSESSDVPQLAQNVALQLRSLLCLAQALIRTSWRQMPRLTAVTRGAIAIDGESLQAFDQAPLWGLLRTIAAEHSELSCRALDVLSEDVSELLAELRREDLEDHVALRGGGRYVARIVRGALPAAGRRRERAGERWYSAEPASDRWALQELAQAPLSAADVSLEIMECALPVQQLMAPSSSGIGLCSARVVSCGSVVRRVRPGQTVLAVIDRAIASHAIVAESRVSPVPEASMRALLATLHPQLIANFVIEQLLTVQRGERVLVLDADSALGRAAVATALHVGAQVTAVARTVPDDAATSAARWLAHASPELQAELDFDFVLSAGANLPQFSELLARAPRVLALQEQELATLFERWLKERPRGFSALFERAVASCAALPPKQPATLPITLLTAAPEHRHLPDADCVLVPTSDRELSISVRDSASPLFHAEASYLITGGLGGLGLGLAEWLASSGAGELFLVSRRAPTHEAAARIEQLRATGVRVTTVAADISVPEQVAALFSRIASTGRPLRGVFHLAGVLLDANVAVQSWDRFEGVLSSKVNGTWLLHEHTRELPLDHFVLYSSVASIFWSPGQCNYAAANAFMDAFAHYRRSLGLPALAINWGAFADIGMSAEPKMHEKLSARGTRSMLPAEAHEALSRLLTSHDAQIGVFPFDVQHWVSNFPRAVSSPTIAEMLKEATVAPQSDTSLLAQLATLPAAERASFMENFVVEQMAYVSRNDVSRIHPNTPISELGLDSLMALELRNRLEAGTGIRLSATLLFAYPNAAMLAVYLANELKLSAASEPVASAPADLPDSTEEMAKLLEQQLASLEAEA